MGLFVSRAELLAWAKQGGAPNTDGVDVTAIDRCILAASQAVAAHCGQVFEETTFTRVFDGDRADGRYKEILRLERGHRPVTFPTSFTVVENGLTLVVAAGYSTSAAVLIVRSGEDKPCALLRRTQSWASGRQNIIVTYKAGYALTPASLVPEPVRQAVCWLAWKFVLEPRRLGVQIGAKGGSFANYVSELPADLKLLLKPYVVI